MADHTKKFGRLTFDEWVGLVATVADNRHGHDPETGTALEKFAESRRQITKYITDPIEIQAKRLGYRQLEELPTSDPEYAKLINLKALFNEYDGLMKRWSNYAIVSRLGFDAQRDMDRIYDRELPKLADKIRECVGSDRYYIPGKEALDESKDKVMANVEEWLEDHDIGQAPLSESERLAQASQGKLNFRALVRKQPDAEIQHG